MNPGPKPSDSRSYARRTVCSFLTLPASATPRRIENTGKARTTSTSSPPTAAGHGWFWRVRLHRAQKLLRVALVERRAPGSAKRSMARPAKPRIAGRRVTAASITSSTASAAPVAMPRMKGMPMKNMPSREITTVQPANSTARPAVVSEVTTACRGSSPSCSPFRYRVTMNSA